MTMTCPGRGRHGQWCAQQGPAHCSQAPPVPTLLTVLGLASTEHDTCDKIKVCFDHAEAYLARRCRTSRLCRTPSEMIISPAAALGAQALGRRRSLPPATQLSSLTTTHLQSAQRASLTTTTTTSSRPSTPMQCLAAARRRTTTAWGRGRQQGVLGGEVRGLQVRKQTISSAC